MPHYYSDGGNGDWYDLSPEPVKASIQVSAIKALASTATQAQLISAITTVDAGVTQRFTSKSLMSRK